MNNFWKDLAFTLLGIIVFFIGFGFGVESALEKKTEACDKYGQMTLEDSAPYTCFRQHALATDSEPVR